MRTIVTATIDILLAEKLERAATIARTSKAAIIQRALQLYLLDPAGEGPPPWDHLAQREKRAAYLAPPKEGPGV